MRIRARVMWGWVSVAAGVVCGIAAFQVAPEAPEAPPPPKLAPDRSAMPAPPSASIVVRGGPEGSLVPPTAAEAARMRDRIAAELEALLAAGGERLAATSGVAYTLGTRGASLAVIVPTEGGPVLSCIDAPESRP